MLVMKQLADWQKIMIIVIIYKYLYKVIINLKNSAVCACVTWRMVCM